MGGTPEPIRIGDRDADGVPVRVPPVARRDLPILVVFHGGGWVIGNVSSTTALRANCDVEAIVVSVDYQRPSIRSAPWKLLALRGPRRRGELGGDPLGSPSAATVVATSRRCARCGAGCQWSRPRAQVLKAHPVCDGNFGASRTRRTAPATPLEAEQMQWFFDCYTEHGKADRANWQISPCVRRISTSRPR